MGIKLIVEMMRTSVDLTPAERLTLIILAEDARDDTRIAYAKKLPPEEIARRVGVKKDSLRRVFQRLAERGYEVRIPIGKTQDGKPVFAFSGMKTNYRIPEMPGPESPLPTSDGGTSVPPYGGTTVPPSEEKGGTPVREGGTPVPPKGGTPVPPFPSDISPQYPSDPPLAALAPEAHAPEQQESSVASRPAVPPSAGSPPARTRQEAAEFIQRSLTEGKPCVHGQKGGTSLHPISGKPLCPLCKNQPPPASKQERRRPLDEYRVKPIDLTSTAWADELYDRE